MNGGFRTRSLAREGTTPTRTTAAESRLALVPTDAAPARATKYSPARAAISDANIRDSACRLADLCKAGAQHLNNVAGSGGDDPYGLTTPDTLMSQALVPENLRTNPLPDGAADTLNMLAGIGIVGNGLVKLWGYRHSQHTLRAALLLSDGIADRAHRANSRRKALGGLHRVGAFAAEKVLDTAGWAAIVTTPWTGEFGYSVGSALVALGHGTNLWGFTGGLIATRATLLDEAHLRHLGATIAPWIRPEVHVKSRAEALLGRLAPEATTVRAEIRRLLDANQEISIDPLVAAVTAFHNRREREWQQDLCDAGLTHWWQHPIAAHLPPVVDMDDPWGAAVATQRSALLPATAARLRRLHEIEAATSGGIRGFDHLQSETELAAYLSRLPAPTQAAGRSGPDRFTAVAQVIDAPVKMALSVAALYFAGTGLFSGMGSDLLYNIVRGFHGLPLGILAPLVALSAVTASSSIFRELRELRTSLREVAPTRPTPEESAPFNPGDRLFYNGAGIISGVLLTAGATMMAFPPARPLAMLIATAGVAVSLVGKQLFYLYKEEPPAEAGRIRRWAHRAYRAVRDTVVTPLAQSGFLRRLLFGRHATLPTPALDTAFEPSALMTASSAQR